MVFFFQKHHRSLFYTTWLVLALAQAASTELIADEAYYWVYSKFLAWGYFDHPPMIAVLIKCGYTFFHNEFGVRLICVLLGFFTLIIIESLIDKKNSFLFYTITLSVGVLQIAGFLAVPDTPLLFFTAVFFYCYRHYLQNINWGNAILLAFSIALLFYTKYHGVLIVLFCFFSNLKLLRRWQTWLSAVCVIFLFAPHLFWQWENDWMSFRYHLFESNVSAYEFSNTTDYLLGQLLVTGPLAGIILLPAAFLYKTKTELEKAMKFTLIGLLVFFLFTSFRGKVEANWTMPALIPMIVLSHQFLITKFSWIKPLRIIAFISLLLVIAGRLYLAVDIGPDNSTKLRFHNNKLWAKTIAAKTGNTPVVFYNSYQRASLFWFYSGVPSHSHNWYGERRSNYNFWPTEINLLGKPVFVADIYGINSFSDSILTKKGWVRFNFDSLYAALGYIQIIPAERSIIVKETKNISIRCKWKVSYLYGNFLSYYKELNPELYAGIFNRKDLVKEIKTGIMVKDFFKGGDFDLPLNFGNIPAGKYILRLGIKSKNYPITHNSDKIGLTIR